MARNFLTITLILKAFFDGFKSRAKISINDNIKTISDLQQKITNIFGIQNFHLLCDEHLLPPCEDICLIKNGDSICAVPDDAKTQASILDENFYTHHEEQCKPKRRKRRSSEQQCPLKEKKCKKKKRSCISISSDEFPISPEGTELKKSKKHNFSEAAKKKKKSCVSTSSDNLPISAGGNDFKKSKKHRFNEKAKKNENEIKNELDDQYFKKKDVLSNKNLNEIFSSTPNDDEHKSSEDFGVKKYRDPFNSISKCKIQANKFGETNLISKETVNAEPCPLNSSLIGEDLREDNFESAGHDSSQYNENAPQQYNRERKMETMSVDSSSSDAEEESKLPNFEVIHEIHSNDQEESSSSEESKRNESDIEEKLPLTTNKIKVDKVKKSKPSIVTKNSKSIGPIFRKKRNEVSWSTLPLSKTTNHVKINKIPIENVETDMSKFVFKSSNAGAVPIPSSNEVKRKASASNLKKSSRSIDFVRSKTNSETASIPSSSFISGCENIDWKSDQNDNVDKTENVLHIENLAGNSLQMNDKVADDSFSSLSKRTGATCESENNQSQNTQSNHKADLESWRQSILDKLSYDDTPKLKSEDKVVENDIEKSTDSATILNSSKVEGLHPDSYKIRKRRLSRQINGVSYYLNLLNKIDWDVSKSISGIDEVEPQLDTSNLKSVPSALEEDKNEVDISEKLVQNMKAEKSSDIVNVENLEPTTSKVVDSSECADSASSVSVDFVTKRKRKRTHRKKVRVATPLPNILKSYNVRPPRLPVISGTPKIHIRFDSQGANKHTDGAPIQEVSLSERPNEKVIILQDISISSEQYEEPTNNSLVVNGLEKIKTDLNSSNKTPQDCISFYSVSDSTINESVSCIEPKITINETKSLSIINVSDCSQLESLESAKAKLLQQVDCLQQVYTGDLEDHNRNVTIDTENSLIK